MVCTQITLPLHFCLFSFLNLLKCYVHNNDGTVVCVCAQYASQQYVYAHNMHVIAHVHRHAACLHVKQLLNCSSQKVCSLDSYFTEVSNSKFHTDPFHDS